METKQKKKKRRTTRFQFICKFAFAANVPGNRFVLFRFSVALAYLSAPLQTRHVRTAVTCLYIYIYRRFGKLKEFFARRRPKRYQFESLRRTRRHVCLAIVSITIDVSIVDTCVAENRRNTKRLCRPSTVNVIRFSLIPVCPAAGHQWVKNNLGVNIKTGWSVDPFGHGPTMPYLLRKSEVTGGAVIQRIHYAWKEWLARTQNGDFVWRQNWDRSGHTDTLVHNMPFDIYSIRGSCGPHPQVSNRTASNKRTTRRPCHFRNAP